jgi:hypothetical protein
MVEIGARTSFSEGQGQMCAREDWLVHRYRTQE